MILPAKNKNLSFCVVAVAISVSPLQSCRALLHQPVLSRRPWRILRGRLPKLARWKIIVGTSASDPAASRMGISPSLASTSDTATEVSAVSVCTAELCMCQDEGFGGGDILETLLSKNLPYAVGEAPCLGACGELFPLPFC